jgi:hypothetical protein
MKRFVTDLGRALIAQGDDGSLVRIPRYAVWAVQHEHVDGIPLPKRPVVIETSESRAHLVRDFGDLPIFTMDQLKG